MIMRRARRRNEMRPCQCFQCRLNRLGELMPLEIKGLKGKALKAGAVFDRLNQAYDKLIETGSAHAADVESLPPQFEAMQDDIEFAVQTLGNSVNGSGESAEKPKTEPVVVKAETDKIAVAVSPAVGTVAETTFRSE